MADSPTTSATTDIVIKKKPLLVISSVSVVEKIFFTQNLGLMIRSGFSIGDALQVLQQQTKSKLFQKQIFSIREDVVKGQSFARALAEFPDTFDELFVSMIEAGELSGNLETTLKQLTEHIKKTYALKRKIKSAMMYPMLIFCLMIVMGTFVFIYVLPNILGLYEGTSYVLPLPTRIILAGNNFIRDNILVIGAALGTIGLALVYTWRQEAGRYQISRLLLRLPVVGNILKSIAIANIARIFYSLIVTDIPIMKSYQMIANAVGNRIYRRHLRETSALLAKGNSIFSTVASREDLFPPVVSQMIKVGEDTGTLDEMMKEIALFYEEEVETTMSNMTSLIEPILMITIGCGVGFLAVAILLPIYGLVDQI